MRVPFVYHPDYHCELPSDHRFPMGKFKKLHDYLIQQRIVAENDLCRPKPVPDEILYRVHSREYVANFRENRLDAKLMRKIGFPWSPELSRRTHIAVSGTLLTCRLALRHGISCNLAGGTHHAFPDYGSGFCIYNDLAVAARQLLHEQAVKRILIVDLDVHQGDGTHFIFKDEPRVFTFSIHCLKNFPVHKQAGDLDIEHPEGTGDREYLACLQEVLPSLVDECRPDLILYDAGVDVHKDDRLGQFELTSNGLHTRDSFVLDTAVRANIPLAAVIGGGYDHDLLPLVQRHASLHRAAKNFDR